MKITISRAINGISSINGDEYALDSNGRKLSFSTVQEAINYLADRNWTIADLRELKFNAEEETA